MGQPSAEQTVMIIESVGEAIGSAQGSMPTPTGSEWWQIFAVVAGAIATLLTAWAGYVAVKRKGKK